MPILWVSLIKSPLCKKPFSLPRPKENSSYTTDLTNNYVTNDLTRGLLSSAQKMYFNFNGLSLLSSYTLFKLPIYKKCADTFFIYSYTTNILFIAGQ